MIDMFCNVLAMKIYHGYEMSSIDDSLESVLEFEDIGLLNMN